MRFLSFPILSLLLAGNYFNKSVAIITLPVRAHNVSLKLDSLTS